MVAAAAKRYVRAAVKLAARGRFGKRDMSTNTAAEAAYLRMFCHFSTCQQPALSHAIGMLVAHV